MLEPHHQPVTPLYKFLWRLFRSSFVGLGIIAISLFIGMLGYHYFEKLSWLDAYLNAAMILSGMGPVAPIQTHAGKLFAGTYALFSGIVFLVVIAIILAPVLHRFLHRFMTKERSK